jgi:hypothetical protein
MLWIRLVRADCFEGCGDGRAVQRSNLLLEKVGGRDAEGAGVSLHFRASLHVITTIHYYNSLFSILPPPSLPVLSPTCSTTPYHQVPFILNLSLSSLLFFPRLFSFITHSSRHALFHYYKLLVSSLPPPSLPVLSPTCSTTPHPHVPFISEYEPLTLLPPLLPSALQNHNAFIPSRPFFLPAHSTSQLFFSEHGSRTCNSCRSAPCALSNKEIHKFIKGALVAGIFASSAQIPLIPLQCLEPSRQRCSAHRCHSFVKG